MGRKILLCTVGGSHQPVVTAIRDLQPQQVVFFCTDNDPATRKAGSRVQVEGKGLCIRAALTEGPTLPNIPSQCDLPVGSHSTVLVPADDLDGACDIMRRAIDTVRERYPEARCIADYTGGTKSMTAALVLAALDRGDIELEFVTGARADLVKVRDGTEATVSAAVEGIRLRQNMVSGLTAWSRYAYDEAAAALGSINAPRDRQLRAAWQRARDLSAGFAAWDRFDHVDAVRRLSVYEGVLAQDLAPSYSALKWMAKRQDARDEARRLWDLWLNAQRRAAAGRYDDAVARAYRLLEWTAQWLLHTEKGWATHDLPADIAIESGVAPNREGNYQAGLYAAWGLAARHCGAVAAAFWKDEQKAMLDNVKRRNHSILAHGFEPISAGDWNAFAAWLETRFIPLLENILIERKVQLFSQLPDRYLWSES